MSGSEDLFRLRYARTYWRNAYETLVQQTGRDLNDGLGMDPRSRKAAGQSPEVTGGDGGEVAPPSVIDRAMMERAGYSVSERSCHIGRAWDWSAPGKGPMDSRHFKSSEEAWADAERAFEQEVRRARELFAAAGQSPEVTGGDGGEVTLTADFTRSLPGGPLDDTSFEQIETALDRADAPCQGPTGKWLTLTERIAALAAGRAPSDHSLDGASTKKEPAPTRQDGEGEESARLRAALEMIANQPDTHATLGGRWIDWAKGRAKAALYPLSQPSLKI